MSSSKGRCSATPFHVLAIIGGYESCLLGYLGNGMKMQLANVQYLFTSGERGLSGASVMILQTYNLLMANPTEFLAT